jgi:ketosteroid isomerase-like protein
MTRRILTAVMLLFPVSWVVAEDPEQLRQQVRAADVAFDRAAGGRDLERFASLIAEDAVFYGSKTLRGRDQVVAGWSPLFAEDTSTTLRWQPEVVEVSESGDLGYTTGPYVLTTVAEDGRPQVSHGTYVTIWRRSQGGAWQAVLDIGTTPKTADPAGQ